MRKGIISLLLILLLTACGASNDGLTTKDLAVQKTGEKKAVVQYGMGRVDAEKILGPGEELNFGHSFEYGSGATVVYREDKVAGIYLSEGSEEVYETVAGLSIGMSKEDVEKIYGKHYLQTADRNMDYAYDSSRKQYLKDTEWAKKFEDDTQIYLISLIFDGNGQVRTIMLSDRKMAMTFR